MKNNQPLSPYLLPDAQKRAKFSLIVYVFLMITFVVLPPFYFYLALTTHSWQSYALLASSVLSAIASAIVLVLFRAKKFNAAGLLTCWASILFIPIAGVAIDGWGIPLGFAIPMITIAVCSFALTTKQITRVLPFGIISGIIVVLVDIYDLIPQLALPVGEYVVPAIVVLGTLIFIFLLAIVFPSYNLKAKMTVTLVAVVIVSVGIAGYTISLISGNAIFNRTGENSQNLADSIARETAADLETQVHLLEATAIQYSAFLQSHNANYTGSAEEIQAELTLLDQAWAEASTNSPLVMSVLINEASRGLRQFKELQGTHSELILTDRYGAVVAATDRTTDYYQADEDWWQIAFNNGQGGTYIGQPSFDLSSQAFGVDIAIPVYTGNQVAGILRGHYNIQAIQDLLTNGDIGETGHAVLRISETQLLGNYSPLTEEDVAALDSVYNSYGQVIFRGVDSLVSEMPLLVPNDYDESDLSLQGIAALNWTVIEYQYSDEALLPLLQTTRTTTLITIVIILITAAIGVFIGQRITQPIETLNSVAIKLAAGDFSVRAQMITQDELGVFGNTLNDMADQLQDVVQSLERRVSDRTDELEARSLELAARSKELEDANESAERRASQLQAVSDVAKAITSFEKMEELLPLITRVISERFGYYHVGVFLNDDVGEYTVLRGTNSEGGQHMLQRGHSLRIGQTGIVGNVAYTGIARIALDTGADAVFFSNPDLPETRSEMALPLRAGKEVIGVLDVQSIEINAFSDADIKILDILAEQVSIALQNASFYEEIQRSSVETQTLLQQYTRNQWGRLAQVEKKVGYSFANGNVKPLEQAIPISEITGNNIAAVPIKIHGQTVGTLGVRSSVSKVWTEDELDIIQAVTERVAIAAENARLLEDSQRRAVKERTIGEITSKIGASINMRNVLQTAVEELGRAIPGTEVVIQFQESE